MTWRPFCIPSAENGVSISFKGFPLNDGHMPLLLALKHNKQEVAELLIQNNANIHAVDNDKRTALMLATKYEAKHIIELLLHGCIDTSVKDQFGKNALSYAIASCFNVNIILDHTNAEHAHMQTRKAESNDSLIRSANNPDPGDIKTTSEKDNNKSDTKNVPERKKVCDFQQSKKDAGGPKQRGTNILVRNR
ncbi:ankyrin repeat domain-containing protein 18A-like [Sciurus carolinensis]|uniref:ankyrin repeat domain-containing protein 18A-like n=1 Tax=Sciurus carolinensis TaxID=30640 RepID=UPI001FB553BA|nr:ankyrin repeat domain-containing protein 18A-like [Sciurus carolinensis]